MRANVIRRITRLESQPPKQPRESVKRVALAETMEKYGEVFYHADYPDETYTEEMREADIQRARDHDEQPPRSMDAILKDYGRVFEGAGS